MKVTRFAVAAVNTFAASALVVAFAAASFAQTAARGSVREFAIAYPEGSQSAARHGGRSYGGGAHDAATPHAGSTHEITFDERRGGDLWITGQNYDSLVRVRTDGRMSFHKMPKGSGPHGIEFDAAGRLWVTLEFQGRVVALDEQGKVVADYDVSIDCSTCPKKINTHPHGLGVAADGETVWFTGKGTGTVGKITRDSKIQTFALPTVGSVPIYIVPGPDGNMWFTEEAGNKVGRVERDGRITEFAVPKSQPNVILAGLAFDREGNLWVQ